MLLATCIVIYCKSKLNITSIPLHPFGWSLLEVVRINGNIERQIKR